MFDISENKSYDIAAYGFGKKIEQHGFEILSCVSARQGKKIFGNDPDITEVKPDFDLLADWIEKNPSGKVAARTKHCYVSMVMMMLHSSQDSIIHITVENRRIKYA